MHHNKPGHTTRCGPVYCLTTVHAVKGIAVNNEWFFNEIVLKQKRFVAHVDNLDNYGASKNMRLFLPRKNTNLESFNLVTSLCSDGLHRPLFDIDLPRDDFVVDGKGFRIARTNIITFSSDTRYWLLRSTHNFHLYVDKPFLYKMYKRSLLRYHSNLAYTRNVEKIGFGSLRPPWVKKEGYRNV